MVVALIAMMKTLGCRLKQLGDHNGWAHVGVVHPHLLFDRSKMGSMENKEEPRFAPIHPPLESSRDFYSSKSSFTGGILGA